MRAEDLFEAMGAMDEELIAHSDRRVRAEQADSSDKGTRKKAAESRKRKKRRAEIYRFAVVAMSTAVVVFLILMARDLLGPRTASDVKSGRSSVQDSGINEASPAENYVLQQPDAAGETAGSAEGTEKVQSVAPEEKLAQAPQEETVQAPLEEAEQAPGSETAKGEASDSNGREKAKAAVDLLGDLKGDYVKIEFISVEEEAKGGNRIVPEYTVEGEIILSEAFSNGKAVPSILASTGKATYYVYLTKEDGVVHKATFYENAYVSLDSIPGVVMKITEEEYEDVMELFRSMEVAS